MEPELSGNCRLKLGNKNGAWIPGTHLMDIWVKVTFTAMKQCNKTH